MDRVKIGDVVRVLGNYNSIDIGWNDRMDDTVDKIGVVENIELEADNKRIFHVNINDREWYYSEDSLEPAGYVRGESVDNRETVDTSNNNGGSTDYYKLPSGAIDLQDVIEHKNMNFAQGNIIKAIYRAGECAHSEYERDLNKIIWFAQRELNRIKNV